MNRIAPCLSTALLLAACRSSAIRRRDGSSVRNFSLRDLAKSADGATAALFKPLPHWRLSPNRNLDRETGLLTSLVFLPI